MQTANTTFNYVVTGHLAGNGTTRKVGGHLSISSQRQNWETGDPLAPENKTDSFGFSISDWSLYFVDPAPETQDIIVTHLSGQTGTLKETSIYIAVMLEGVTGDKVWNLDKMWGNCVHFYDKNGLRFDPEGYFKLAPVIELYDLGSSFTYENLDFVSGSGRLWLIRQDQQQPASPQNLGVS
jgi:hypothetical protein